MPALLAVAIQLPIRPGAVDANVDQAVQRLSAAGRRGAGLAVLPDLWSTGGLTARPRRDSELSQGAVDEIRRVAARYGMVVVGSVLTCDRGLYYDEAQVIDADGELVGSYRRIHRVGQATSDFAAGREAPTFATAVGRIGVLLAEDLWFPEQAVSLAEHRARLLVVPSSWEEDDIRDGQTLATARALETQSFVIAANRAAETLESRSLGGSLVLDPRGQALAVGGDEAEIVAAEIDPDRAQLERTRRPLARARVPAEPGPGGGEAVAASGARPAPAPGRVLTRAEMAAEAEALRASGRTLVFTNGCFDLLHVGHVRLLRAARAFGDALCLGLNTDASVRALKGPERPLQNEEDRAEVLAALACVDYVVLFDEETPLELITAVQPDVLVKGGDYTPDTVVGRDVVEARGGRVEIVRLVEGRSTSSLVERVRSR